MNKFKIFGLVLLTSVSVSQAQDINQAKKAIDAEKYEEAKSILKSILQAKPSNGMASFILGNVYLTQSIKDSARISYEKGLTASESARFNHIGLGQIDLDNNDIPFHLPQLSLLWLPKICVKKILKNMYISLGLI
ncbi:hypothetical protein [Flavobacterium keumense]|uniref:tetratricopeptide repeat protein n=1 Tax=Flavobacterium keumense TaxID=1306518 RepID=UPI00313A1B2B